MSSSDAIGTPDLSDPRPARAGGRSRGRFCVGRSKATDSPVCPARGGKPVPLVESRAVEKPAYWRIVQSLVR